MKDRPFAVASGSVRRSAIGDAAAGAVAPLPERSISRASVGGDAAAGQIFCIHYCWYRSPDLGRRSCEKTF